MRPIWHGMRILLTILRFRLDTILLELAKDHWVRWFLLSRYLPQPKSSSAVRLRLAIEYLGPVFIKFGQILSTRRDLLPTDYADELAKLQDQVPPFPTDEAVEVIEKELGTSLDTIFKDFDEVPIASASLAQVYATKLHDDRPVVIKVIRPKVEGQIRRDLELIFQAARFLNIISSDARRLHLVEVVQDYEVTIYNELDLTQEAANTIKLRYNFANSPLLYAPRVYNDYTTSDVLVMERIYGIPISNMGELREAGTDLKKLAVRGVETFFTQVFEHNFFHADMHPGNIFVDVTDPLDPSYIAIDCAIMGELTSEDQTYLARNIVAFFNQDFAEIANLHLESGWIGAASNTEEFEQVIRELCEPLFQQPLSQISFGHFLLDLFKTARRFDIEVQPQLVLLQKTLLNIEGLGRQLDPELDLWATAKPFMEDWMQKRFGIEATVQSVIENLPALAMNLPELPRHLLTAERRLSILERQLKVQGHAIDSLQQTINRANQPKPKKFLSTVLLAIALALLGITVYWVPDANSYTRAAGFISAGVLFCVASALMVRGR